MRWGIRTSLVLGLAGLLLAAGGMAAAVVVRLLGGEAEAQVLAAQRRVAAAEARALEAGCALAADCAAGLRAALDGLAGEDAVARAVYGPGGLALAGEAGPDPLALDVVQGGGAAWAREVRPAGHPWGPGVDHRVAVPLRLADGRRAAAVTVFALDGLHAAVAARRRLVVGYLLFGFGAVLLFGIYVSGRVLVRPLRRLTLAVERIGAEQDGGDGARLPPPSGPAELWRLSEAFSAMLDRLARRRAALAAARDELVRSEKLATVGRLAAGVAHEVGNPLASVMGFVEYLRDPRGCPPAVQADLLARMDRELGRIRDTLRQLLDFSRPAPMRLAAVDAAAVARSAAALVGFQRAMAGVEVAVEVAAEAPPVRADGDRLRQVLVNLLLNAGEAGAQRVEVQIEGEGEGLAIRVRDDGPGVDPAVAEALFEPFATTRPAGQGTGLGLAISRRLVEDMGGRLAHVAGAPGEGACFALWLPPAPVDSAGRVS